MKRDEFLEKFREFAPQAIWKIRGRTIIGKSGSNIFCPITFVNYKMTGNYYYGQNFIEAGTELGLTRKDIFDIMAATDGMPESLMELRGNLFDIITGGNDV